MPEDFWRTISLTIPRSRGHIYDVYLCKITTSVTRNISVFSVQGHVYKRTVAEGRGKIRPVYSWKS